jgi:chorismate dehydratase
MYKFAVLPYANAAPLVHFIPQVYPNAKLTHLKPCNTTLELISGRVDAAIIPIVDYFNMPALEMVKGIGICANGNVESVLLQCKYPLKDVRTIKLDPASRTSNLLLKVLIKKHFRIGHDIRFGKNIENPDAEVVIGDRALCGKPAFESYDLAGEWKNMTGLPFVFAVWAYRVGYSDSQKLTQILQAAKQAGCNDIGNLSKLQAERLGINEEQCYHYLTDCLHYDIGTDEQAAMDLFRQVSMDLTNIQNKTNKVITTQNLKESTNAQPRRQCI